MSTTVCPSSECHTCRSGLAATMRIQSGPKADCSIHKLAKLILRRFGHHSLSVASKDGNDLQQLIATVQTMWSAFGTQLYVFNYPRPASFYLRLKFAPGMFMWVLKCHVFGGTCELLPLIECHSLMLMRCSSSALHQRCSSACRHHCTYTQPKC